MIEVTDDDEVDNNKTSEGSISPWNYDNGDGRNKVK
jgi:hypothetical protein